MHPLLIVGVLVNNHRWLFVMGVMLVLWLPMVWLRGWPRVQIALLVVVLAGMFIISRMIE
jgi:hypothetical protein